MGTLGRRYYHMLLAIYFVALALCSAARIMLKMRFIDLDTGFYTANNGIVLVFNIALLAAVLILFVTNRLRMSSSDYPVYYRSSLSGFLAILVGISIILYMFLEQPYSMAMEQGLSEFWTLVRDIASKVLGLLAGISMIWIGIGNITDRLSRAAIFPALFGSFWQVFMLVTRFNSFTVLTTISDNLLTVLFMVFASLFLVGQARTTFGLTRKDGRNYTIPTGLCTSLTGLLLVVPNYLYMWMRDIAMPAPMLGQIESIYILMMSIYAPVTVWGMIRSIKQV